jgi:hypothetical protein
MTTTVNPATQTAIKIAIDIAITTFFMSQDCCCDISLLHLRGNRKQKAVTCGLMGTSPHFAGGGCTVGKDSRKEGRCNLSGDAK